MQKLHRKHQRLFVQTGVACSTNSSIPDYLSSIDHPSAALVVAAGRAFWWGAYNWKPRQHALIPDYRDSDGNRKRRQPVRFQAFVAEEIMRRRYLVAQHGRLATVRTGPNDAHQALARFSSPRTWTGCTRPPGAGR